MTPHLVGMAYFTDAITPCCLFAAMVGMDAKDRKIKRLERLVAEQAAISANCYSESMNSNANGPRLEKTRPATDS